MPGTATGRRGTLVDRYAPLIWAICRRYRLDRADAADVGQSVWLRLLEQLEKIRDRTALAGWLATTAQRECIRVLHTRRPQPAGYVPDADNVPWLPGCRTGWVSLQAGARGGRMRCRWRRQRMRVDCLRPQAARRVQKAQPCAITVCSCYS